MDRLPVSFKRHFRATTSDCLSCKDESLAQVRTLQTPLQPLQAATRRVVGSDVLYTDIVENGELNDYILHFN